MIGMNGYRSGTDLINLANVMSGGTFEPIRNRYVFCGEDTVRVKKFKIDLRCVGVQDQRARAG